MVQMEWSVPGYFGDVPDYHLLRFKKGYRVLCRQKSEITESA